MLRNPAMAPQHNYHIRAHPGGWAVTREGASAIGSIHPTKSEALVAGRECAKRDKVELVVHQKNERAMQ
jgi:Uncharacterized protein conserved in bacteria (DUF2188)